MRDKAFVFMLLSLMLLFVGAVGCDDVDPRQEQDQEEDLAQEIEEVEEEVDLEPLCGEETCGENQTCCEEQCVDLEQDAAHCGSCGAACGANEVCEEGLCVCDGPKGTKQCTESQACCESLGCVEVVANISNCGACGVACGDGELCVDGECSCGTETAEGAVCSEGTVCCQGSCVEVDDPLCVCGLGACGVGQFCCDESCVNPYTDEENCGACGETCTLGEVCAEGQCQCSEGLDDCDGDASNGCETQIESDFANCGICGHACEAGEVCSDGECRTTCETGSVNCEGSCVDLFTNRSNCGACGIECTAGEVCSLGSCQPDCDDGMNNCGGVCEDLNIDHSNCGACGRVCPVGEVCWAGNCTLNCPSDLLRCDDTCVDPESDRGNCGACGMACDVGEFCLEGACAIECLASLTPCSGACVDLDISRLHCGGCGVACEFGQDCIDGSCVSQCPEGFFYCDGRCIDPELDQGYCGSVGCEDPRPCGDSQSCIAGECICDPGSGDCNGEASDGCEIQLPTDAENCGACGHECSAGDSCCQGNCVDREWDAFNCGTCGTECPPADNATPICDSGDCSFTCLDGFGDCDLDSSNGCEDTLDGVTHCGACGVLCSDNNATPSCVAGSCELACAAGWGDCDLDASNGCETPLNTVENCGACGTLCDPINASAASCDHGACSFACTNDADGIGYGDCNGIGADGCETLLDSIENCGACDNACSTFHSQPSCDPVEGLCYNMLCDAGWEDCDGMMSETAGPNNGCETDLSQPETCGSCYNDCQDYYDGDGSTPYTVGFSCDLNAYQSCGVVCEDGYFDCDVDGWSGCETGPGQDYEVCPDPCTECAGTYVYGYAYVAGCAPECDFSGEVYSSEGIIHGADYCSWPAEAMGYQPEYDVSKAIGVPDTGGYLVTFTYNETTESWSILMETADGACTFSGEALRYGCFWNSLVGDVYLDGEPGTATESCRMNIYTSYGE